MTNPHSRHTRLLRGIVAPLLAGIVALIALRWVVDLVGVDPWWAALSLQLVLALGLVWAISWIATGGIGRR